MEKDHVPAERLPDVTPETDTGLFDTEKFLINIVRKRHHALSKTGLDIAQYCAEQIAATDNPLEPTANAWRLLADAGKERQNIPSGSLDAMNETLLDPPTGLWMAHMLRVRRGDITVEDPDELWGHAGYLHSMAASAAIRANLDFRITVPTWDGCLMLPGIGQAILPEYATAERRWNSAIVTSAGGNITILDRGGNVQCAVPWRTDGPMPDNWLPMPNATAHIPGDDTPFTLTLDHINPYRFSKGPIAPRDDLNRLNDDEEAAWLNQLQAGMGLLAQDHPILARQVASVMRTVVPSNTTSIRFRPASSSAADSIGATTIGWQHDTVEMAATLAHEGNHNLLNSQMLTSVLLLSGGERPENLYAPWRDDPRHDYGLLHGVVSFLAVTEFYHQRALITDQPEKERKLAQLAFAHWFQQAYYAKEELDQCITLTPEGRALMKKIDARFKAMSDPEIPADTAKLADHIAEYHKARWAAHHLRLTPNDRDHIVRRWFYGTEEEAYGTTQSGHWYLTWELPELHFEPEAWRFDTWFVLANMAIADPHQLQELLQDPASIPERIQGATHADVAYFAENKKLARDLYTQRLTDLATYDDPAAIIGLSYLENHDSVHSLKRLAYIYRDIQRATVEKFGEPAPPMRVAMFLWMVHGEFTGPQISGEVYNPARLAHHYSL